MQRRILAVLASAVVLLAPGAAAPTATAAPGAASQPAQSVSGPEHRPDGRAATYLALGDSLAAGYQPGKGDDKTGGYVGQVLSVLRQRHPSTQLVNLACSGETAASMVAGDHCTYPEGSQLAAAVAYLTAHRGRVPVVTVDIGANDVQRCVSGAGVDMGCIQTGMAAVTTDLAVIFGQLRAAAPGAQIVALDYYDPFLAAWLLGAPGQQLAQVSVGLADTLNTTIKRTATQDRIQVADVAKAFRTHTWRIVTDPTLGQVPKNVQVICTWTWMCTLGDIHANDAGYAVLARTVVARLH